MGIRKAAIITGLFIAFSCTSRIEVEPSDSDLMFGDLAAVWDEAMPLGNATVGELVWQKGDNLRLSLDRIDLWDLRPIEAFKGEDYSFEWVKEHVRKGDYDPVVDLFEKKSYLAAPSKIPGAALEVDISSLGKVIENRLFLNNALCEVKWESGASMKTFVQADGEVGWIVFENIPESFDIQLVPPEYQVRGADEAGLGSSSLALLGYPQGEVTRKGNLITYHQCGWKDYFYDVAVNWKRHGNSVIAAWSVTSSLSGKDAGAEVAKALAIGPHHGSRCHNPAAVRPGDVQVRLSHQEGLLPYIATIGVDRGRWFPAAMERGLS